MIQFRVLGTVDLRDELAGEMRGVLAQPKRLALLAYLAVAHPVRFHRRDTLLALFWPHLDASRARDALSQALHYLRDALGPGVLDARGTAVGISPSALWCDAGAFRAMVADGQCAEALDLYRGDLLAGFHASATSPELEEWMDAERREFRRLACTAALDLAEREADAGRAARVGALVRQSMLYAPESEADLRRAVRLLDRVGDRAAVLSFYADFSRRLSADLDAEPAPETRALIESIRARRLPHPPSDDSAPIGPAAPEPPEPPEPDSAPERAAGAPLSAAPARRWRGPSRQRVAAVGVGAVASVGAAWFALGRDAAPAPLLDNVVVVAPMHVLAPGLDLWREGLVDVLSRTLDGAGDLRAIAPEVALQAAARTPRATADELARRTRARFVLLGVLQRAGADSARLSVTVHDATRRVTRGHVDRRDAIARMDHLADSAAVDVLRVLSAEPTHSATLIRTTGTRSFAALKEFLRGQAYARRRMWDSSATHFLRALAIDSTFALAYVGTARALAERPVSRAVPEASHYAFRAAAFNGGLGARDSSLIAIDSLFFAAYANTHALPRDPHHWAHIRRVFAMAERLVAEYPLDAEAWTKYAEVLYHLGGVATRTREEDVLEAFDRAIALDPALGAAYSHIGGLALLLRGWEGQARYGLVAARQGIEHAARDVGIGEALASADATRARRLVDTLPADALWDNFQTVVATDADGTHIAAATARLRTAIRTGQLSISDDDLNRRAVVLLLKFGRFQEAARLADESHPLPFASAALVGAVADARAAPVFARWLASPTPPFECLRLLDWWAQRGDTASVERCTARRWRELQQDSLASVRDIARAVDALGQGFGALARRDTARAVRALDAFPDSLCPVWCWFALEPRIRLLAAVGRTREAFELSRARSHVDFAFTPGSVPLALTRARLAAAMGDPSASRAYQVVAEVWAHADASLQPAVMAAAAAIGASKGRRIVRR